MRIHQTSIAVVLCKQNPFYANVMPETNSSGVKITRCYINHTSTTVTVSEMSNMKFTVPPVISIAPHQFIIRDIIDIPRDNLDEVRNSYTDDLQRSIRSNELALIHEAISRTPHPKNYHSLRIVIDTTIEAHQLIEKKLLYCAEKNVMLSIFSPHAMPVHPHSNAGYAERYFQDVVQDKTGFWMHVKVIANDGEVDKKYFTALNQTMRVEPQQDVNRESGIYVSIFETDNDRANPKEQYYTLAEGAQLLGLHPSRELAEIDGDFKLAANLAIAGNAVKKSELELEVKKECSFREIKRADRDEEKEERIDRREERRAEREDKLLERESDRKEKDQAHKERIEFWKSIPVLLTAVAAGFGFYLKLKSILKS